MDKNVSSQGKKYSKYFWMPVWIVAVSCVAVVIFQAGSFADYWSLDSEYRDNLAVDAIQNPGKALEVAEEGVRTGRLDFALYRSLLRAALSGPGEETPDGTFQSIARVLSSGGSFAKDLQRELASMPPHVFVVTAMNPRGDPRAREAAIRIMAIMLSGPPADATDDVKKLINDFAQNLRNLPVQVVLATARGSGSENIEQELKRLGLDVILHETLDPTEITRTEVLCFDQACRQTAQSVAKLLRDKAYDLSDPTGGPDSGVSEQSDEATKLLNQKAIRIILAQAKNNQTDGADLGMVREVQTALNKLGFLPAGDVDGLDGPKTKAALRKFQKSVGLPPNGDRSQATIDALRKPVPTASVAQR
jgi:hypothetical protein